MKLGWWSLFLGARSQLFDTMCSPAQKPQYNFLSGKPRLAELLVHAFDYASFDSGAKIVDASPSLKDAKAVQDPKSEVYMIGSCDQPTWLVISFSEQISLEYVAFHYLELFSSFYG